MTNIEELLGKPLSLKEAKKRRVNNFADRGEQQLRPAMGLPQFINYLGHALLANHRIQQSLQG